MSQITTLITGAGAITSVLAQDNLDQYITIGDCDTAMPLQGLQVDINSVQQINIVASQPLMSAFAKLMSQFCATIVGIVLKVATGKIRGNTNYRFVNNGVTTPAIFASSGGDIGGNPVNAIMDSVQATSNKTYSGFKYLLVTPVANIGSFDVGFTDGSSNTAMTVIEADSLFSIKNPTEANGRVDQAVTGFDNRDNSIAWVRVNATTAVSVLPIKF
jgi:hypothetical protein